MQRISSTAMSEKAQSASSRQQEDKMDAKELTPIVQKNKDEIFLLKKQVEFLTQEFEKQRILLEDMKIDVQMMQRSRHG